MSWSGGTGSGGSNGSGGTRRNSNRHGLAVQQEVVLEAICSDDAARGGNHCSVGTGGKKDCHGVVVPVVVVAMIVVVLEKK